MKFKVGDRVRLTREAIYSPPEETDKDISHLMEGDTVVEINDGGIILSYKNYTIYNPDLFELVPEEPEFEYGEAIEVKIDEGSPWVERPFIYFAKGNAIHPYITANINKVQFDAGKKFDFQDFKYARKLKPQLTRKEIAEKFGVSLDFTFVD